MSKRFPGVFLPAEISDSYALQALAEGAATPEQQKAVVKCIIEEIAGTYDMTFDPDSMRNSDFAEGRRSVGRSIVGILKTNLGKVKVADERLATRKRKGN